MPASTNMKQGKLNFASSKHTAIAGAKKTSAKNQSAVKSNIEETAEVKEEAKKISIKPRSSSNSLPQEQTKSDSKDQSSSESLPHLNIKDPRWRRLFADAKAKRNGQSLSMSDVVTLAGF
jgi:DNA polymerase delta subunit 4